MRAAPSWCALFAVLVAAPAVAQSNANVTIVPYGGYNADAEEIFFAGGVGIPLASVQIKGQPIVIQPSFEFYPFIDNVTLFSLVGMIIIPIELQNRPPVVPYGIGSLSWTRISFDAGIVSGSSSDIFIGFGGGVAFAQSITQTHPFVELEARVGDGSSVYLKGGVRIGVG